MRSGSSGGLGSSVSAGSEVSVLTEFLNPGGAQTGALFPTGSTLDTVFVGGQPLEVTVVDAGNLCMIATADSWERATGVSVRGLQKGETKPFEEARISIATQTGIALDGAVPPNTPKLLIIGPGADTPPWPMGEDELADMWGMTLSMGVPHTAFPVTGGIGVSAAAADPDFRHELLDGGRVQFQGDRDEFSAEVPAMALVTLSSVSCAWIRAPRFSRGMIQSGVWSACWVNARIEETAGPRRRKVLRALSLPPWSPGGQGPIRALGFLSDQGLDGFGRFPAMCSYGRDELRRLGRAWRASS